MIFLKKILAILLISVFFLVFATQTFGETALTQEKTYEEFLEIIPDSSFVGEYATFETKIPFHSITPLSHKSYILISELFEAGILPEIKQMPTIDLKENPYALRLTEETVREVFENTFGPDLFDNWEEKNFIATSANALTYEPERKTYGYTYSVWAGGLSQVVPRYSPESYEEVNGTVYLYLRLGVWYFGEEESQLLESLATDAKILADTDIFAENGPELFKNGTLDEYFPLYKVTFKDNGNGGYYWASTEMVEAGTPIPTEQFSEKQEENSTAEDPTAEDSTEGNHTILGGNWGSTSSQPPATDTDSAPKPEGTPTWGIVLRWGIILLGGGMVAAAIYIAVRVTKKSSSKS